MARMQERGAHLTIQHVHSHLEKKTTQTHPKYNKRWQLAAADEACEQPYVYPFQTPPTLGIERFPVYHPNNLKRSLFLPEFLLKFLHKLWLQRLPTLHLRHFRGDYEGEVPGQPYCTICSQTGVIAHETLPHVFLDCLSKDRLTHLRQKANNTFRQFYPLSPSYK